MSYGSVTMRPPDAAQRAADFAAACVLLQCALYLGQEQAALVFWARAAQIQPGWAPN